MDVALGKGLSLQINVKLTFYYRASPRLQKSESGLRSVTAVLHHLTLYEAYTICNDEDKPDNALTSSNTIFSLARFHQSDKTGRPLDAQRPFQRDSLKEAANTGTGHVPYLISP